MSWSCPVHSFQLPLHAPVIFSVCPLHFPCLSRSFVASQLFTSPVVLIGCLVLCFLFLPPALPLFSSLSLSVPFCFPFISRCFPVMSTFRALPCISPVLPSISHKNTFLSVFAQRTSKNTEFSRFSAKGERAGRRIRARDPCLATPAPQRLRLVERHQITARYGGPIRGVRHAGQCQRTYFLENAFSRQIGCKVNWSPMREFRL